MTIEYELLPKQHQLFHLVFEHTESGYQIARNNLREFAYFGGFGAAKSLIMMLIVLFICLLYPNTQWVYCRLTYRQLKDSVIPQFQDKFPPEKFGYTYFKGDNEFRFTNGSVIYLRAFDNPRKILSNMYHGATICQGEELAEDHYNQLWGRIRLPGLGKNLLFVEGNPSNGWCRDRYVTNPLSDTTVFFTATTFENPYLDVNYILEMAKRYPPGWIRRYIFGEWENFDEMVFSSFVESRDVKPCPEIGYTWQLINGFDYGYRNASAITYLTLDYDDNIWVYDEFKATQQSLSNLTTQINRYKSGNNRSGKIITVADYSIRAPGADGKDIYSELQQKGCALIPAKKHNKINNIQHLNWLFANEKIKISPKCVELIKEIKNYRWKRVKIGFEGNFPEEVIKVDDHLVDSLLYAITEIRRMRAIEPGNYESKKNKAIMKKMGLLPKKNYKGEQDVQYITNSLY